MNDQERKQTEKISEKIGNLITELEQLREAELQTIDKMMLPVRHSAAGEYAEETLGLLNAAINSLEDAKDKLEGAVN